ncbi:MAG: hypothetical protein QXQ79_01670 [Candidatus Nanoarchaeia archaeon]
MLFKKKEQKQTPVISVNLIDLVKQANLHLKYEEIGSWLVAHNTPLFWCHDKGFSIVDKNFIEQRPWLKKALNRMIKEIEEQKQKAQEQKQMSDLTMKPEQNNTEYIR